VELSELPVILAGGLHAENVAEAILEVQPAGVDVHTGVKNGNMRNDPGKVNKFISNALEAFNEDLT
jgi:phosphoribosylanthranilate isomerase